MDPKDFFRGFFGMPPRQPPPNSPFQNPGFQMPSEQESDDDFENPLSPEHRNNPNNPGFQGSFRVFTSPLEMESFFSQQFDEMLKQFGGGGNFSGIFGEGGAIPKEGVEFSEGLRESHENSREEEDSRDFMLRKDDNPGYLRPENSRERHDVEVDHLPEDFGKFHAPGPHIEPESRHNNHQGFTKSFNFGQSFSSSSVRLQDGSIEEKQVTKDNEGRETTTVIKKSGEDCYTVTTIKHPDGQEERQESNSCPQLNDFSRSFSGQLGNLARESIVDRIFKF